MSLANFIDKGIIINIHIIEGINPRPGDGLSHLRHGVSGVDKMTPSPLCSQIIVEKKTQVQAQAQDKARA